MADDNKRYEQVRAAMQAAAIAGSEAGLLTGLDLQAHIFLAAFDAALSGPEEEPPPTESDDKGDGA